MDQRLAANLLRGFRVFLAEKPFKIVQFWDLTDSRLCSNNSRSHEKSFYFKYLKNSIENTFLQTFGKDIADTKDTHFFFSKVLS